MTTCCICDPTLRISPHVCEKHKREARALATERGCWYRDAAADLYFAAKQKAQAQ